MGGISRDWHPLGFSQMGIKKDPCGVPVKTYCEFEDWKKAGAQFKSNFGARVFLIRNLEIAKISGRILIDFNKPAEQPSGHWDSVKFTALSEAIPETG